MSGQVQWRAVRQPSGDVDTDLFDVAPVTLTANRFARSAALVFDDVDGAKSDAYPRGQRVELEVSTDGGSSWTRRSAGFVQDKTDAAQGATTDVELVGYDHLLRRREVYKTYTDATISTILEDLITSFTAVQWVAGNVDVGNDTTITREFKGERVDEAIQELASRSADERFGVTDDFEFFFRQQDTSRAPSIVDGDWLDYDLPEDGKRAVNRVRLFYGQSGSESSVIVEDREAQRDLKDQLAASRRVVISTEATYPEIGNEDAARDKAKQLLGQRSERLTGTVTTFGHFDTSPGDVLRLQINEKNVDTDFAVAQIEHYWSRDETKLTLAENRGDVGDLLVGLSDEVGRVSARAADPDAGFTRFLEFTSGVTVAVDATVRRDELAADQFLAGFGRSTPGFERADRPGFRLESRTEVAVESLSPTKAFLNLLRDLWQGESSTDLTHLALGHGGDGATRSDTALIDEATRHALQHAGPTGTSSVELEGSRLPAGGALAGTSLQEAGVFDAASGGNLYTRVTFDSTHSASTIHSVDLVLTLDDDPDRQGVITTTGQERLRDLVVGETGHEPATMVYGTDTTSETAGDTALGAKVHEDAIDSTADRSTGITDVVERIAAGEVNGNDLSELGEENASDELLSRLVFEPLAKTSDFALETTHRFVVENA